VKAGLTPVRPDKTVADPPLAESSEGVNGFRVPLRPAIGGTSVGHPP